MELLCRLHIASSSSATFLFFRCWCYFWAVYKYLYTSLKCSHPWNCSNHVASSKAGDDGAVVLWEFCWFSRAKPVVVFGCCAGTRVSLLFWCHLFNSWEQLSCKSLAECSNWLFFVLLFVKRYKVDGVWVGKHWATFVLTLSWQHQKTPDGFAAASVSELFPSLALVTAKTQCRVGSGEKERQKWWLANLDPSEMLLEKIISEFWDFGLKKQA